MKEDNIIKIDDLAIELSLNKSNVVNMAIDDFGATLESKKVKEEGKKSILFEEISLIDIRLEELDRKITKQKEVYDLLEGERNRFRKIIKTKFDTDNKLEGLGIAKRMSSLLNCDYLELLPLN